MRWINKLELVTKAIMDTHIRDNLNALHAPTSSYAVTDHASDYTTTSATFADIDTTNISSGSRTWNGGLVLVSFFCTISHSLNTGSATAAFDIALDGTRVGGDDGVIAWRQGATAGVQSALAFARVIAISAGAHTITIQWKTAGATLTLYAGAGTSNYDVHPVLSCIEV